ncbi:uncharacterized protein [Drosophila kikkawai]|uniref:Dynein regulatory complex protein 9 n=1 Tax=Drosophila kikkawai TaxID=30033 RepID=A0ABM3C6G1_DROKI|nr:uncharacterized protein LOC108070508 isoform X1 [Drosophila kikkawai]
MSKKNSVNLVIMDAAESQSAESDQYAIRFPIPEITDPSMCRDEFIKNYVESEEKRINLLKPRSVLSHRSMSVVIQMPEENPDAEPKLANVIHKWLELARSGVKHQSSIRKSVERTSRMSQLMQLNQQCQKAAIEFMSVRLLRQLRLFSYPWPGKLDEIPNNLFSWSLDNFMARLEINQLYLDVINRERTTEDLDCLKFRADLHEMMRLIYEIREDFSEDQDMCENSIQMLREAKYNLDGPWIKGLAENIQTREKLRGYVELNTSSSVNMKNIRLTEVLDQFEDVSALDPIELRYRFNWLNSCADQRLMRLNGREDELAKQLKDLEDTIRKDKLVRNHSEHMYAIEVDNLRDKLNEWQMRFENDLENVEVECTVARLALQKVKDDHKFYMEQEKMFKRRIAEERELMAQEEKIRRDKQAKAERATIDVAAAVKVIEAVYKPKQPAKKKKKSAKF